MTKITVYNLVGDEETARGFMPRAQGMADAGVTYDTPDSMTSILISGNTATITVEMDCPYHLMVPKGAPQYGPSAYFIYLLGYSHRKDAIVPIGINLTQVEVLPGEGQYGNEVHYISDGLALLSSGITDLQTIAHWTPEDFSTVVSINSGVMEDALYAKVDAGNHQGFTTTRRYFPMTRIVDLQGNNHHSIIPHGVDRANPDAPVYAGIIGNLIRNGDTVYFQQADGSPALTIGERKVSYRDVKQCLSYLYDGSSTSNYGYFELADDFFDIPLPGATDLESGDYSAPHPLLFSAGNLTSVIIFRKRNNNPAKLFGGTFSLGAYQVSGTAMTLYGASVSALTNTYFYSNTFSFHEEDYPAPATDHGKVSSLNDVFYPFDEQRMTVLLHTLGKDQRNQLAISATETITFGVRIRCNKKPTEYGYDAQLCCFSITTAGITQKSIVKTYWSEYADYTDIPANTSRWGYGYFRTVYVAPNTVALIFRRTVAATPLGPHLLDGYFRVVSTDGGTTWGSEQQVSFDGVAQNWQWSLPKVVKLGIDADSAILIAGYIQTDLNVDQTTKTYKTASVLQSTDGGLNWELSSTAAPSLEYSIESDYSFPNGDSGVGSIHAHGSWEEGFEPSPHKHLPTYYGTPTAICRDASNDAGL